MMKILTIFIIFGHLFLVENSKAEAILEPLPYSSSPYKVLHYPQAHYSPSLQNEAKFNSSPLSTLSLTRLQFINLILESQFDLLKVIRANGDRIVFDERVPYDFLSLESINEDEAKNILAFFHPTEFLNNISTWPVIKDMLFGNVSSHTVKTLVEAAFPEGIPSDLAQFSDLQKSVLIKLGASLVLLYLGELDHVYSPYLSRAHQDKIFEEIERLKESYDESIEELPISCSPEYRRLTTTVREESARDQIQKYLKTNPDAKVLLVYGSSHDFREHFPNLKKLSPKMSEETIKVYNYLLFTIHQTSQLCLLMTSGNRKIKIIHLRKKGP